MYSTTDLWGPQGKKLALKGSPGTLSRDGLQARCAAFEAPKTRLA